MRNNIYFVVDEIYVVIVFVGENFVSVVEVVKDLDSFEVNVYLIYIVYSFFKDMGFFGFRVGIVYFYNDLVVLCVRKMLSFGLVLF